MYNHITTEQVIPNYSPRYRNVTTTSPSLGKDEKFTYSLSGGWEILPLLVRTIALRVFVSVRCGVDSISVLGEITGAVFVFVGCGRGMRCRRFLQ